MVKYNLVRRRAIFASLGLFALALLPSVAASQNLDGRIGIGNDAIQFDVSGPSQRLEMIVNTSRILTLDLNIPRALVNNPDLVQLTPLSPHQIQISALSPGVTQVNLWDENEQVHTLDVVVTGDARELQMLLEEEFPNATLRVRPLASSVIIAGFVDRPESVSQIVRIAEDYYPTVVNNISVGGVQQVMLHVQIMEVSRTKLRTLGIDWASVNGSDFIIQSVSGLISAVSADGGVVAGTGGASMRFGVVDGNNSFFGLIEALKQNNLVKVLAEPTLVTMSGRPASFNSGGEVPTLIPGGLGTITIEYREFGTRVDFVPIVLGNGAIRLEVRPQVSELDQANGITVDNTNVPGFRTRWVDTAVEMQAGQTLALAGLIQTRIEAETRGVPWVSDLPWVGAGFRRVTERENEIELLIMVTPELVDAVDLGQMPPCGPGQSTTSPSDTELYFQGYLEVPRCCPDGTCSQCVGGYSEEVYPYGAPLTEEIQPSTPTLVPPSSNTAPLPPDMEAYRRGPTRAAVNPNDRYNSRNVPTLNRATTPERPHSQGRLFGPIGYDVLE